MVRCVCSRLLPDYTGLVEQRVEDSKKADSVRSENFKAVVSKFVGNTAINAGASWSQAGSVKTKSCTVAYTGILFGGGGVPTNSVEDRGQKERGSEGGSP